MSQLHWSTWNQQNPCGMVPTCLAVGHLCWGCFWSTLASFPQSLRMMGRIIQEHDLAIPWGITSELQGPVKNFQLPSKLIYLLSSPRTATQGQRSRANMYVYLYIYIYICVCARACHCIHNMFCNSDIYISLYIHIFTAYICHWKGTTNQAMSWPNCIPCWLQSERAEPKLMRDEGGAFQLKLRNCGFICRDLFKSFYYGKS